MSELNHMQAYIVSRDFVTVIVILFSDINASYDILCVLGP